MTQCTTHACYTCSVSHAFCHTSDCKSLQVKLHLNRHLYCWVTTLSLSLLPLLSDCVLSKLAKLFRGSTDFLELDGLQVATAAEMLCTCLLMLKQLIRFCYLIFA